MYTAKGDMRLDRRDNGPGVTATCTLSGNMDFRLTKGKEKIRGLEQLMNVRTKPYNGDASAEGLFE
jgi:hypothetical protein